MKVSVLPARTPTEEYESRQRRAFRALVHWSKDVAMGKNLPLAAYADIHGIEPWTCYRALREPAVQERLLKDPALIGGKVVVLNVIGQLVGRSQDPNQRTRDLVEMGTFAAKLEAGGFGKSDVNVNVMAQVNVPVSLSEADKVKHLSRAEVLLHDLL